MAPADVQSLLHRRPFEPFRIVSADGTTYEVRHPDLVMVGLASVIVGYPDQAQPTVFQRFDVVSLRQIQRLEMAPQAIQQP